MKFQKTETQSFVDERALIITTLIYFCLRKILVPFCLRKKRPENAFLTLIVNYRKIVQKNKSCRPKQQQIGYLMIYDVTYLLLILIKKLAFFKKKIARVYYILRVDISKEKINLIKKKRKQLQFLQHLLLRLLQIINAFSASHLIKILSLA